MYRLIASAVFGLVVSSTITLAVRADQLYWTDYTFNSIRRANLDGSGLETVLGNLPGASALAVDEAAGKMYWSETQGGNRIRRANLDGSGVETVLATPSPVYDIAVDPPSNTIFFTQTYAPIPEIPQAIRAANLDGSSPRTVVSHPDLKADSVAFINGRVYYVGGSGGSILSVKPDGSDPQTLTPSAGGGTFEMLPNPANGLLIWLDEDDDFIRSQENFELFHMRSLTSDPFQEFQPWGLAVDAGTNRLYWSDAATRKIQSLALHGGTADDYQVVLELDGEPRRMAIVVPEPAGALMLLIGLPLFYRGVRRRPLRIRED